MVRRDVDEATRARMGVISCNPQAVVMSRARRRPTHDLVSHGPEWPERWGAGDVKNCKRKLVLRERIELSEPLPYQGVPSRCSTKS
jgi:hypothetical protein